jgi:hypothetical protein
MDLSGRQLSHLHVPDCIEAADQQITCNATQGEPMERSITSVSSRMTDERRRCRWRDKCCGRPIFWMGVRFTPHIFFRVLVGETGERGLPIIVSSPLRMR